MHEAVAPRKNGHECTEIHQARNLPLVNPADFDIGGDEFDTPLRLAPRGAADRGDLHRAVVLDVDGGAGLFGDLPNDRATLADDVADLLLIYLQGDDRRRPVGHLFARGAQYLVHFAQNVQTPMTRLIERNAHDLRGHTLDLDIHLQGRDAVLRAGHLEVHIAQVILVTEDVRQHLEAPAFEHEAHRNPCNRSQERNSRIHERKACSANTRHGA